MAPASRVQRSLAQLYAAGSVGIVIGDDAGSILEANDAFLTMTGYTRDDFDAGLVDWRTMTPSEWLPRDDVATAELAGRGAFGPYEKEYIHKDGHRIPVSVGGARLTETTDEQICYVVDLSDIHRAEAALRATTQRLDESEQRYRTLAEAMPQIVMLADEQRRMVYANRYYEEYTGLSRTDVTNAWHGVIHPDDLPAIGRARATGEDYEIEYRLRRATDGMYRWHFARCQRVPLPTGSGWLATAIDIDDRKRAEESLEFLATAGARLSQSLDLQTTFATLLDLVVPRLGDWATITQRGADGTIATIVGRHRDPAKDDLIRQLCGTETVRESAPAGTAAAYRTGAAQVLLGRSRDDVATSIKEAFIPIYEQLGYGSTVVLPICADDAVIGTFNIMSAGDARISIEADLPVLQELAVRAGFAIGNARRYQREHRVAEVLQEAALPRRLPVVAGFTFDAHYRAGNQEAVIGGDWFDAFVTPDGQIVLSVGDVAGSGLEAAVLMGSVRQLLRGVAAVNADPLAMLDIADRTLRGDHEQMLVTAFVGVIDPATRRMRYASAGHVPPLVWVASGDVTDLSAPGLPLGCRDLGESQGATIELAHGARLLLYTDGLIEWSRDVLAGEALLRERFARETSCGARSLVECVLTEEGARDDVAALLVCVA